MVGIESALAGVHAHHWSGERVAETGRDRVDGWIQEEERGENQEGRDEGAIPDDEARELEGGGFADMVLGYFGHGLPALVESSLGGSVSRSKDEPRGTAAPAAGTQVQPISDRIEGQAPSATDSSGVGCGSPRLREYDTGVEAIISAGSHPGSPLSPARRSHRDRRHGSGRGNRGAGSPGRRGGGSGSPGGGLR